MHIAAGEEQVAILDHLVDLRQVLLQIRARWLNRIERFEGLLDLHQAVKVVVQLEKLSALLVLALGFLQFAHERATFVGLGVQIVCIPSDELVTNKAVIQDIILIILIVVDLLALIIERGDGLDHETIANYVTRVLPCADLRELGQLLLLSLLLRFELTRLRILCSAGALQFECGGGGLSEI